MAASLVSRMPGLEERSWEDSVVENSVISWLSGDQLILARPGPALVWSCLKLSFYSHSELLAGGCWPGLAWVGEKLTCLLYFLVD